MIQSSHKFAVRNVRYWSRLRCAVWDDPIKLKLNIKVSLNSTLCFGVKYKHEIKFKETRSFKPCVKWNPSHRFWISYLFLWFFLAASEKCKYCQHEVISSFCSWIDVNNRYFLGFISFFEVQIIYQTSRCSRDKSSKFGFELFSVIKMIVYLFKIITIQSLCSCEEKIRIKVKIRD